MTIITTGLAGGYDLQRFLVFCLQELDFEIIRFTTFKYTQTTFKTTKHRTYALTLYTENSQKSEHGWECMDFVS